MTSMSPSSAPPRPRFVTVLTRPFQRFFALEASSSILLLLATIVALVWANSPFAESYHHIFHGHTEAEKLTVSFFGIHLSMSLGHWINDALMAIFFFVVGMEIKREIAYGELSNVQRAMLPVVAAVGGMVVPASIYAAFHWGAPTINGWGVPMATDIAFAVAALSVFGSRVPPGLKVFLLALAIADDIGAVAVIAIFYASGVQPDYLLYAGIGLIGIVLLNKVGVRAYGVYLIAGGVVWYLTHHSGVHATIAGVAIGFLTPARRDDDEGETLIQQGGHLLERLRDLVIGEDADHGGHARHHVTRELSFIGRRSLSPLDYLTNLLHPWVAFFIMPIFALANAGVALSPETLNNAVAMKVGVAVALGLLVGKPIGVGLFAWVAVKSGIAIMPRRCNWGAIIATGFLAGIGFTVALFVTSLAFVELAPAYTDGSKIGILVGSFLALALGVTMLARYLPRDD